MNRLTIQRKVLKAVLFVCRRGFQPHYCIGYTVEQIDHIKIGYDMAMNEVYRLRREVVKGV
jgi:hypothetical protein